MVDDGPCLQAIWEHETVRVDDMAHEDRWPRFAPRAADAGIGSMLAFQLYTTESNLGALNLLSASPHAFDSTSVSVGGSLATHAAIAVIAAQREGATSPRGMNALPPDSSIPAKEEVDPLRRDDIDLPRKPSSTLRPGGSRSRTWASSAPGSGAQLTPTSTPAGRSSSSFAARVRPLCRASVTAARSANALPVHMATAGSFPNMLMVKALNAVPAVMPKVITDVWKVLTRFPVPPISTTRVTRGGFMDTPASPTTSTMVRTRGWVWPASASTPSETNSKAWPNRRTPTACLSASFPTIRLPTRAQSPYARSISVVASAPNPALSSRRGVK
ncbi:RNA binding sensor regulator [Prescottella equi NBRC 101255 = C 7]|nr:RNA binding sensor regulator [Prescottella equi NBRC 101255 = C 7]